MSYGLYNVEWILSKPPEIKRGDLVRVERGGTTYEIKVSDVIPAGERILTGDDSWPPGTKIEGVARVVSYGDTAQES